MLETFFYMRTVLEKKKLLERLPKRESSDEKQGKKEQCAADD